MRHPAGLVTDPAYLRHAPGSWPESPERLRAVLGRFASSRVHERAQLIPARRATDRELRRIHHEEYLRRLEVLAGRGGDYLDPDTVVTAESYEVAKLAAGGCLAAVDAAFSESGPRTSLCLVRPPGHHAFPRRGTGFCLLNNVAIAAAHALEEHDVERVLIVDWDVHHGNGTETIFYDRRDVLYLSVHQSPLYPGTGGLADTGEAEGQGYNVNLPLPPGAGDADSLAAFDRLFLPIARAYRPQLVLVSSGHDGHFADPLGSMCCTASGYHQLAARMRALAEEFAGGRLIAVLEGGYHEEALGWCLLAVFDAMAGLGMERGDVPGAPSQEAGPSPEAAHRIAQAVAIHAPGWPCLGN
ncbi:MAG TPA: histone deacetylase [Clostridiales bacterium]|nr:histone deacetylase [Clostridiales bacterium]